MPVVTTAVKNQPSKRASFERTARRHRSVSSCTGPASGRAGCWPSGIATTGSAPGVSAHSCQRPHPPRPRGRRPRALPMALPAPVSPSPPPGAQLPDQPGREPVPDSELLPSAGAPAERAVLQESVRLAFVAALQLLPPRQRVVLILREVL